MKKETILLVDDEKEIVDLLGVYLSNDGYSVCKCYNGTDAMKCIENSEIDLAILDVSELLCKHNFSASSLV